MQRGFTRRGGTSPASESKVLKLKGLPYATKEADLLDFFRDFKLIRVALVAEPDGRPSGLAFAEFENCEEAVRAMSARNGDYIGDRYVKLLRVPHEEMEEQTGLGPSGVLGSRQPSMPDGFGGAPQQQQQPFAGGGIAPAAQQHVGPRPNAWGQNRASGDQRGGYGQHQGGYGFGMGGGGQGWSPMSAPQAFVGYHSTQPQQGGGFNGQHGLFPGNGLGGMQGALGPWVGNGGAAVQVNLPPDDGQKPIALLITEQQAAIRDAHRAAAVSAATPSYQQALGSGSGGMAQFPPQQQQSWPQQQQPLPQGMGLGGGVGGDSVTPPLGQGQAVVQQGRPGGPGHGHGSSFCSASEAPQRPQQRIIKTDGSTIKIRGLPFRATPEEILAFFDGYAAIADSLFLGSDGRGRPSGEGWLTFESPEEALRCARERNRQYMGSRYLEISLC